MREVVLVIHKFTCEKVLSHFISCGYILSLPFTFNSVDLTVLLITSKTGTLAGGKTLSHCMPLGKVL